MKILITFLYLFVFNILNSQVDLFDSCGLDESVILNKFEIKVIDSLFLNNSIKSKKTDSSNFIPFNFEGKKVLFYSCTKATDNNGNGILSKKEFYSYGKTNFKGHTGKFNFILTENEREKYGFDCILIIDCLYIQREFFLEKVFN
jgi:hypothetical protein